MSDEVSVSAKFPVEYLRRFTDIVRHLPDDQEVTIELTGLYDGTVVGFYHDNDPDRPSIAMEFKVESPTPLPIPTIEGVELPTIGCCKGLGRPGPVEPVAGEATESPPRRCCREEAV